MQYRRLLTGLILAMAVSAMLTACASTAMKAQNKLALPSQDHIADITRGQQTFIEHCAACHGQEGRGSEQGPPLVHKTYRPDHHSDMSFYKAVQAGTYQHHWRFGNMPAVENISPEQTADIIAYVRALQRKAGIK